MAKGFSAGTCTPIRGFAMGLSLACWEQRWGAQRGRRRRVASRAHRWVMQWGWQRTISFVTRLFIVKTRQVDLFVMHWKIEKVSTTFYRTSLRDVPFCSLVELPHACLCSIPTEGDSIHMHTHKGLVTSLNMNKTYICFISIYFIYIYIIRSLPTQTVL